MGDGLAYWLGLETLMSLTGVPGFMGCLCLLSAASCPRTPGGEAGMVQMAGFLPPRWETWMELPVLGIGRVNKQMGTSSNMSIEQNKNMFSLQGYSDPAISKQLISQVSYKVMVSKL